MSLQKRSAVLNGFPGSRLASLRPGYEIAAAKEGREGTVNLF
ncbi:MAG TPA: hypothetical protein VNO32_04045 [Candidatus Acidoferrum sp.]|nr:hypothetical protein [Candidatus Acidoferrum sp.]